MKANHEPPSALLLLQLSLDRLAVQPSDPPSAWSRVSGRWSRAQYGRARVGGLVARARRCREGAAARRPPGPPDRAAPTAPRTVRLAAAAPPRRRQRTSVLGRVVVGGEGGVRVRRLSAAETTRAQRFSGQVPRVVRGGSCRRGASSALELSRSVGHRAFFGLPHRENLRSLWLSGVGQWLRCCGLAWWWSLDVDDDPLELVVGRAGEHPLDVA